MFKSHVAGNGLGAHALHMGWVWASCVQAMEQVRASRGSLACNKRPKERENVGHITILRFRAIYQRDPTNFQGVA